MKESDGLVKVNGVVVPAAWDEQGRVTAVAISAFDEQEYLVEADSVGPDWLGLIRREVEVLGRVGHGLTGGRQYLVVEEVKAKPRRVGG